MTTATQLRQQLQRCRRRPPHNIYCYILLFIFQDGLLSRECGRAMRPGCCAAAAIKTAIKTATINGRPGLCSKLALL